MNWYKQNKLFLLAACSIWSSLSFSVAGNSLVRDAVKCDRIDAAYQEVYSFETENYYINICQQNSKFFYHRQSKLKDGTNILVPATTIFRGNVYQAKVGKTTYFVGVDSDRYYSSVMLNDNEIVFEPEIESIPNVQISQSAPSSIPNDYDTKQDDNSLVSANASLSDRPAQVDRELICAKDKSAFHPDLDGWQQLIGKSIVSANKYAVSNGYDFVYDRQNPNLALITTKEGATIDLSIASNNEVIERICIQSDLKTQL